MSLRDWLHNGWLVKHRTTPEAIGDLLAVVERDLSDCRAEGVSADWRLSIAYNAALQVATAALAASGYRASREAHHYRTIRTLRYTISPDPATVEQLDAFRKKRNVTGYDRAGVTSEKEVEEMIALAERLRESLLEWLRAEHPELG